MSRPTMPGPDVRGVISENIRALRKRAGLSQAEIARRAGMTLGKTISIAVYSLMERGHEHGRYRNWEAREVAAFALVLGVPPGALFDDGLVARMEGRARYIEEQIRMQTTASSVYRSWRAVGHDHEQALIEVATAGFEVADVDSTDVPE